MDVVQEIEVLLGRQAVEQLDFEALEVAVRQQVLQLAGRAIEQRLNTDTADETGSRIACRCGGQACFAGRRSKQFHSVLGPLRLERAYYYCPTCGDGFFPRDRHLGMENTALSPALTRMTATVGAMVSFQEGSELLKELAGVTVDIKQVERTAEALGQEIAEDEQRNSEPLDTLPLPKTLYLGIDGTGIPLRAEELTGIPVRLPVVRKPGKSSCVPSGVRNPAMPKASRSATKDRSAILRPSSVPQRWTLPRSVLPLHSGSGARPSVAASRRPRVWLRSAMELLGSGISLRSCSPGPFRSSIAFMPSNT